METRHPEHIAAPFEMPQPSLGGAERWEPLTWSKLTPRIQNRIDWELVIACPLTHPLLKTALLSASAAHPSDSACRQRASNMQRNSSSLAVLPPTTPRLNALPSRTEHVTCRAVPPCLHVNPTSRSGRTFNAHLRAHS